MTKLMRFISLILWIFLVATCSPATQATSLPKAAPSQTAQTLVATQALPSATPAANLSPTKTIGTESPIAIPTSAPSNPQCTDAATFVMDVTISDGTQLTPGQPFTKTWRLKNTGTCAWTTAYTVELEAGPSNAFWTDSPHPLAARVEPDQTVDVSVDLTAPTIPGNYTAFYQLHTPQGVSLLDFYTTIKVQAQSTTTGFAVMNVTYTVSTWSDLVNGKQYTDCPLVTATITANGAGTVTYHWVAFESKSPTANTSIESGTLTFDFAGAKSVSQRVMYRESTGGQGMLFLGDSSGIYIDAPGNQAFQGILLPVCSVP
ncbi:MAG: NBR1-Ig-like domain-containing protein [Chloroflexi bacterium]|nr:NBR1-Ig-like domain-containing protein [Chloroflexota bacterium]